MDIHVLPWKAPSPVIALVVAAMVILSRTMDAWTPKMARRTHTATGKRDDVDFALRN
jgi:hypothetical protein